MKKCIILANGKPPKKSAITYFKKNEFKTLICADGGANSALKLGIIPDYIIGDLDSASSKTLNAFKSKSRIIKIKRQNDTDVEKCLKFAIKSGCKEVVLMGATGNRLDHTFCNLGIVLKFFLKLKIILIAEDSVLIPYSGNVELKTLPGETISVYGIDSETKITSSGLKYPLKNIALPFGEKESTSNVAEKEIVKLRIKDGVIFIVRDFYKLKKNNFFESAISENNYSNR